MVKKEITETVEVTNVEEVTDEITFCDGCGMATDEYETYVSLRRRRLERVVNEPREKARENIARGIWGSCDVRHFCPGCEAGMEEHQSIPAGLHGPDDTTHDHGEATAGVVDSPIKRPLVFPFFTVMLWATGIACLGVGLTGGPAFALVGFILALGFWASSVALRGLFGMRVSELEYLR